MRIFTVVGARPQFVKAAVVSRELAKYSDIEEVIVHTGQHYDDKMSDIFFDEMEIPQPKYNLDINGVGHGAMTGQMLEGLERLMIEENPDVVLVYGDTNSTLAGALAAKKIHIPVAHIEAGLRSFNMEMPEEINRILTDRISDILFTPTDTAIENLEKEGFENYDCQIIKSGDVMQDAAMHYAEYSLDKSNILNEVNLNNFVLCTIHRAENTNDLSKLKSICNALNSIHKNRPVVLPIHPRTKKIIDKEGIKLDVKIIDPVGYFDMIELLKNCSLVMTDSGGLQKEAFFFNKNCITLREQTEWVELISGGYNVLTGSDEEKIISSFDKMILRENDFSENLYGNGMAGAVIVKSLYDFLKRLN